MAAGRQSSPFDFSASERRGIRVLVVLCLLSAGYHYCVPAWVSRKQIERFERDHAGLLAELRSPPSPAAQAEPYSGNPGDSMVPGSEVSRTYRPAAPRPVAQRERFQSVRPPDPSARLHINRDDAEGMIRTGLVPAVLAHRIVRYRESLGGFLHAGQLAEVYGLDDSLYQSLSGRIVVDTVALRVLNVNTASAEELMAHPYIHKGLANQIVNYREKAGPYGGPEELLKLYFMDGETLVKLAPYIRVE